jgi:hypothetical protein
MPQDQPVDVMVILADHFEPVRALRKPGDLEAGVAAEAVARWCREYEMLAGRFHDADGRPPQYSWFYAVDFPEFGALQQLSASAYRGFGEVELHLHHGHDTEESFSTKLRDGLAWSARAGVMLTAEPEPRHRFAYIAGNWALDNGGGDDATSGCNTEIGALQRLGCYADFTFPAFGMPAQPLKTNALYYAKDCPKPKSYDWGVDCQVGKARRDELLMVQGPLVIDWASGKFENGALESHFPPAPDRLDAWLKAHVHVRGRPEWVFVKLFTHGIQNWEAMLGGGAEAMFAAMVERWNRPPFRLHFVTAREAHNIIRAAEAGHAGSPNDYRDFEIPLPANRRVSCDAPWRLLAYAPDRVRLTVEGPGPARLAFAEHGLRSVAGAVRALDARFRDGELCRLDVEGEGPIKVVLAWAGAERRLTLQPGTWLPDTEEVACG